MSAGWDDAHGDCWWKNAVVYCLDVETFLDSNGDGIGDFRGLSSRLDYLRGLGVTCLWLMPCFPTGGRDDGYDVTDFYAIDSRLGTLGDFVEFLRAANERGIRVIVDLVVNHVSREHPWFQSARSDPRSPFRDWFVWRDERPEEEAAVIFPDEEESNWRWDEAAGQYYLHRFYAEQPDLNVANREVISEIHRIMGFWLRLGISGFRVDAVPYLIEDIGIEEEMPDEPHALLREMRSHLHLRGGDAILLGEVNLEPGRREAFFGERGDEMTGLFDFILSGALFLAVAREDASVLAKHLGARPPPPGRCQWFHFLRNHDELNLSRLPEDERRAVMEAYAGDPDVRIFDRGIRRRMAGLLAHDPRRMRLLLSQMFALPGTPVLYYGQEIGMGDDLSLPGRLAVRGPMQWSARRNGGFSAAPEAQLVRPPNRDVRGGFPGANVAAQRDDPASLLSWMERLIRVRKETPEIGAGRFGLVEAPDPAVLVCRYEGPSRVVYAAHNLGGRAARARLDARAPDAPDDLDELFADRAYAAPARSGFDLGPWGYRWFCAPRADDPTRLS